MSKVNPLALVAGAVLNGFKVEAAGNKPAPLDFITKAEDLTFTRDNQAVWLTARGWRVSSVDERGYLGEPQFFKDLGAALTFARDRERWQVWKGNDCMLQAFSTRRAASEYCLLMFDIYGYDISYTVREREEA